MKRCFKCGASKRVTDFYRHPRMADGRLGKCKECTKRDVTANRNLRHEYYAKYDRDRANEPKRLSDTAAYHRRWRNSYPERAKAHKAVARAKSKGLLTPSSHCERCGSSQPVQAHHEDYSRPLDVKWLCLQCHKEDEHGHRISAARATRKKVA